MTRDVLLDDLWQHASQLGSDELRVLNYVAEGLVSGRKLYGELDLARDRRNWDRETMAELRDALVYLGAKACSPPRT